MIRHKVGIDTIAAISNSRAVADKMVTPTITDRNGTKASSLKALRVTFPGKWPWTESVENIQMLKQESILATCSHCSLYRS